MQESKVPGHAQQAQAAFRKVIAAGVYGERDDWYMCNALVRACRDGVISEAECTLCSRQIEAYLVRLQKVSGYRQYRVLSTLLRGAGLSELRNITQADFSAGMGRYIFWNWTKKPNARHFRAGKYPWAEVVVPSPEAA